MIVLFDDAHIEAVKRINEGLKRFVVLDGRIEEQPKDYITCEVLMIYDTDGLIKGGYNMFLYKYYSNKNTIFVHIGSTT